MFPGWNPRDKDDRGTKNPIDSALSMEAREMQSALRLPKDGQLDEETRLQIRTLAQRHIAEHGLTIKAVSRQCGVSESTLHEALAGTYKGKIENVLRKVNAWLNDDAVRRTKSRLIGFYHTSVFKSIRDAAAVAKRNAVTDPNRDIGSDRPRIVIATGPSGCGKSIGAEALCAEDPNALYIRIRTGGGGSNALIRQIIDAGGWGGRESVRHCFAKLIARLKFTGRLLIIDEAHKLREGGYETLRDITDECGVPALLLGTEAASKRVETTRLGMGRYMDDQFSRRVCFVVDLLRGSDGEGGSKRPFFSLEEIRAIFRDDVVRLTDDGEEFLCAIANTIGIGMLAEAANIYDKAMMYASRRRTHKVIDEQLLRSACKRVLIKDGFGLNADSHPVMRQIDRSLKHVRELKRAAG